MKQLTQSQQQFLVRRLFGFLHVKCNAAGPVGDLAEVDEARRKVPALTHDRSFTGPA